MKSVALSGFMATGKSTVGRLVAAELGLPFVDTDAVLAERAGCTVGELFAKDGEGRFRDREIDLVMPLLSDGVARVISLGGGTLTVPRVRHAALEAATVVTLTAAPETIVARAASIAERPNLGSRSPLDRARDLLALRREVYAECHATVDTEGKRPDEIAARVCAIARRDMLAVPLGTRSYAVDIADGEPRRLADVIAEIAPTGIVVLTDANVRAARGDWLDQALASCSRAPSVVVELPPGEEHKTSASVVRIWDEALGAGVDRRALVLAFGGGVVGDLAGFAASTLLRGVRCVQIPTTLLAMVDSSVGGKTGFDHAAGKNLVGAFFQPSHVVVDLDHLTTLPARQVSAGLAEVVKIAFACDAPLLRLLEANADAIARLDRAVLRDVVRASIVAKIRVVRDDERESGRRALLNVGHTVGHALEADGGYATWLHGEAVSIGTVLEIEACERLGITPAGMAARAEALLARFGLPTRVPRADVDRAWSFVLADKKRTAGHVAFPVITGEGDGRVERVDLETLRGALVAAP